MTFDIGTAVWTAEIEAWDINAGASSTLYFASRADFLVSGSPATTQFSMTLVQPALAQRTAFGAHRTKGEGTFTVGEILLENAEGRLDIYSRLAFDGRSVVIKTGSSGGEYTTDFTTVLSATMKGVLFGQDKVRIQLRDWSRAASVPIQTATYGGTNSLPNGLDGTADIAGKAKPVLLGKVRNIEPICVNTSKLIYQVHDGAIESVEAAYDEGVQLGQGIAWTRRTFPATAGDVLCASTYISSTYVVAGYGSGTKGVIGRSTDGGVTWTRLTPAAMSGYDPSSIASNGSVLAVVAVGGGIFSSSDAGATWTARATGLAHMRDVCWSSDFSLFVAVGDGGVIYTSPTGTTWTSRTSGTAQNLNGVCAAKKQVVAVGDVTTIVSSLDGINWNTRTVALATTHYGSCVYDARTGFLATGIDYNTSAGGVGTSATSPDGDTWSRVDGFVDTYSPRGMAPGVNGGAAIAVGFDGTDTALASSTDGGTWYVIARPFQVSGGGQPTNIGGDIGHAIGACNNDYLVVGYTASGGEIWQGSGTNVVYASTTDLEDDTKAPQAGSIIACPSGGYFRLGSSPAGRITADVLQGASSSDRTAGQLFTAVVLRAGFASGKWSTSDVTTLDGLNSAECGYYTASGDQVTCANAIDEIADSVGAAWFTDAGGILRIKRLDNPDQNIVSHPSSLNTSPWGVGANNTVSEGYFGSGGINYNRIVGDGSTGYVAQPITMTGNTAKVLTYRVLNQGHSGQDVRMLYDDTAAGPILEVLETWHVDGTVDFALPVGASLDVIHMQDNSYSVKAVSNTATAAHTNVVYASDVFFLGSGGLTEQLLSEIHVYDAEVGATIAQSSMDGMTQAPSEDDDGGLPCYRVVVRASKNYAPMTGTDIAGSVSDADRAEFMAEYMDAGTSVSTSVQTAHPLSSQLVKQTLLASVSDASTEATRLQALFGAQRRWYDVPCVLNQNTVNIEIGDVIEVSTDRYLIGAGTRAVVLGVTPDIASGDVTFSVWGIP